MPSKLNKEEHLPSPLIRISPITINTGWTCSVHNNNEVNHIIGYQITEKYISPTKYSIKHLTKTKLTNKKKPAETYNTNLETNKLVPMQDHQTMQSKKKKWNPKQNSSSFSF